jgi:hypothetical protein
MESFVDLNKLIGPLRGAKKLMEKVDTGDYEKGHIDENAFSGDGEYGEPVRQRKPVVNTQPITENAIDNSRLPDAIKRVMKENPISQPESFMKPFTLNEDEYDRKIPLPSQIKRKQVTENVSQNRSNNTSNMSDDKIRGLVQEELAKFFSSYFMKSMTENIQKDTIKSLIEKGIIQKKTNR